MKKHKVIAKVIVIKTAKQLNKLFEKFDAEKVIGKLAKGVAKRIDDEYKNGQQAKAETIVPQGTTITLQMYPKAEEYK